MRSAFSGLWCNRVSRGLDLIHRLAAFGAGAGVFADVARPSAAWAVEGDTVLKIGFLREDQLFQNVTEAVVKSNMHERVTVKKRKDIGYFREMGVGVTPALVIDRRVVSKGKVLAEDRIIDILRKEQD